MRTALFNYLFAKKHGGDFILRIEDTDSKREVPGSVDYIKRSFDWLGISPNEGYGIEGGHGPYKQSMRRDIYKKHVDMLVESGHAYYAFDTPEELKKMRSDLKASGVKNTGYSGSIRERMKNSLYMPKDKVDELLDSGVPYVVRFNMPRNEDVKFHDEVRGWVTFNTSRLDDKVIWKSSDGLPTYHLANIVDDHLMEITHVIRGEEWVSSTPLHVLLYDAFDWEHPKYAHLPLILGPDGKKLGKRNKYGIPVFSLDWDYTDIEGEEVHISGFREAGIEPDALVNFLALLGWNPGDNVEFMSLDEMIDSFSLDRVNSAGAMFDMKKLDSFNSHYLRSRDRDVIIGYMNIPEDHGLSDDKLEVLAEAAVERAVYAHELDGAMSYIFNRPSLEGELKIKNVDEFLKIVNVFAADDMIDDHDDSDWTRRNIRMELESIATNTETKLGKAMPMLRLALSGGEPGPQVVDIMYLIGHEETKHRINALISKVKQLA